MEDIQPSRILHYPTNPVQTALIINQQALYTAKSVRIPCETSLTQLTTD
uniref:Uncharacterized protein n=1 Tax=Arundo donax TaxID=35708 RepID=A0A0A9HE58_ARUDO